MSSTAVAKMSSTDMENALADVTKEMDNVNIKDHEAAKRSRAAGWVEPMLYDYDSYNAGNPSNEERQAAEGILLVPTWAANAAKYEWKDDYGDVGPRFQDLEDELFNDEYINRIGIEFAK